MTKEISKDILQRQDIELLVNRFYETVTSDELLKPICSQVDWSSHLPTMYDFWSSMLLGDHTYQGNPLVKHLKLPIEQKLFGRWLELFREAVAENLRREIRRSKNPGAVNYSYFSIQDGIKKVTSQSR